MQNSLLLDRLLFLKAIGYKFISPNDKNITQNFIFRNLDELKNQINLCSLCYLKNGSQSTFLGYGNTNAKILFITFSSDVIEDEFKIIKNNLKLNEEEIYVSSLLRCKSNKSVPNECVQMCKPYIFQEINLLKPKLIVALGTKVLFALMPELKNSDINAIRGSFLKFADTILMPTFSPEWLSKNPSYKSEFLTDLNKINLMLN